MALSKVGSIPYRCPASSQQLAWHKAGAKTHAKIGMNDRMKTLLGGMVLLVQIDTDRDQKPL